MLKNEKIKYNKEEQTVTVGRETLNNTMDKNANELRYPVRADIRLFRFNQKGNARSLFIYKRKNRIDHITPIKNSNV